MYQYITNMDLNLNLIKVYVCNKDYNEIMNAWFINLYEN